MKALQAKQKGYQSLEMEDLENPHPERDELLIRTRAASINPIDWKILEGGMFDWPIVPGADGAGVVEAVGEEVEDYNPGDEVMAFLGGSRHGTHAEYFTIPRKGVAHKPNTIPFELAAALPVVALTAWQSLFDVADLEAGQRVLIHAAAGGVGHIAVQLAKWRGAEVFGTASAQNRDYLKKIGCDHFINYREQDFEKEIDQVDVVLATIGGDTLKKSLNILSEDGILVAITGRDLTDSDERAEPFLAEQNPRQLNKIGQMVAQGTIKPYVQKTYDWGSFMEAYRTSANGHVRGKVVLQW